VRPRRRRPHRGEPPQVGGHPGGPPRAVRERLRAGHGQGLQHRADGGLRARVPPRLLGGARRRRARARREPRRTLPRGPPAPRRRPLAEAHARLPAGRRNGEARVQGREDGALHPDGEEVLMVAEPLGDVLASSEERRVEGSEKVSITVRVRRYNPEVREESWWDEWEISMEPNDRLLDALHHIKWYED